MTMRQSALLAMRSPPRLSRCRLVFPEAGTGDTPHKLANAASERRRSGLSPAATRRARLQVLLYDASRDSIVGRGRTIPFRWDGTLEDHPAGIDALGLRAIDDPEPPTALSALAAEVAEDQQGKGPRRSDHHVDDGGRPGRRAGSARRTRPSELEGPIPVDPGPTSRPSARDGGTYGRGVAAEGHSNACLPDVTPVC